MRSKRSDFARSGGESIEEHSSEYEGFKSVVSDEVTEIESGNSFAAREAIFFLATTPEPAKVLAIIQRFGSDKTADFQGSK